MTKTVKAYALFLPEIRQLLAQKDFATLKMALREINPVDLAEGWKEFTPEERVALFQMLGQRRAVVVFEELDVEDQTALLQAIENENFVEVAAAKRELLIKDGSRLRELILD